MSVGIDIRRARPRDIPHVVRMLPGIAKRPSQVELYIVENDGKFAGCAALLFNTESICSFLWNFISLAEKNLALAELSAVLYAEASRQQMKTMMAYFGVKEGTADADLMESLGCHEHVTFNFYETDLAKGEEVFKRSLDLLIKHKKVSVNARVISLAEAPALPVQALWQESIGVGNDALLMQFEQQKFSPRHSVVAMDGPRVVGSIAIDITGKIPHAPYMAVEKAYRGRWTYPMLMREAHTRLREDGYERVQFKTNPQHHAGLKNFAQKVDGKAAGREIFYAFEM